MPHKTPTLLLAALVLACAQPASARTPDGWSLVLGGASDNRSKDASKSDGAPFVYGFAEWENGSGLFYAASGFQTIKSPSGSELELEIGVGLRPQIAGFDLDLNASRKHQVDAGAGFDDSIWEVTADVSRSIGPARGRLRWQFSPDGKGRTEQWTWVEARLGWDLTDRLQATAAIGRREQNNNIDYNGWNAGLTYALTPRLEAELRYHATDADVPGEQYADALVAGISFAF